MAKLRRVSVLLLLITLLAAPWASAASLRSASPHPADLLSRAWAFLASLWSKVGCDIDPDGRCVSTPAPAPAPTSPWTKAGCDIDPNGRCTPAPAPPPTPSSSVDSGCGIDPSGCGF